MSSTRRNNQTLSASLSKKRSSGRRWGVLASRQELRERRQGDCLRSHLWRWRQTVVTKSSWMSLRLRLTDVTSLPGSILSMICYYHHYHVPEKCDSWRLKYQSNFSSSERLIKTPLLIKATSFKSEEHLALRQPSICPLSIKERTHTPLSIYLAKCSINIKLISPLRVSITQAVFLSTH